MVLAVGLIGGNDGTYLARNLFPAGGARDVHVAASWLASPSPTPRATEEKQEAEALSEVVRATLLPARELHGATPPAGIAAAIRLYDWDWAWAERTAFCESRWNPLAEGRAGERGLMQIHPIHIPRIQRLGYTWAQMYEVGPNLAVAFDLWSEQGTRPWRGSSSCRG